jgi:hypothetical protein
MPQKRGPEVVVSPLVKQNRELQAVIARLSKKLKNAELIIEVQRKWLCCWATRFRTSGSTRRTHERRLGVGRQRRQSGCLPLLGVPRASLYRRMQPAAPCRVRPRPARALCAAERQIVLDHLHSQRFCDKAPSEIYARLLDEDIYLCSIRTMHRILAENGELKEQQRSRPVMDKLHAWLEAQLAERKTEIAPPSPKFGSRIYCGTGSP